MSWGRQTPSHVHRSAKAPLMFGAGVLLALAGVAAQKQLQQPQAPQHAPEVATHVHAADIDMSKPHVLSISLDEFGTGVNNVAIADVDGLRSHTYEQLLAGLPEPLRAQAHNQKNIRAFTDKVVESQVSRLPKVHEAFASAMQTGDIQNSRVLCVATGMSEKQTLQDFLYNFAGLKVRSEDFTLDMADIRRQIDDHEKEHCYHGDISVPVVRETLSDAMAIARRVQQDGNFDVAYAFRDLRTAHLLHTRSANHATAPFLTDFIQKLEQEESLQGLDDDALREKVTTLILGEPEQHLHSMNKMMTQAMQVSNAARNIHQGMYINPYSCRLVERENATMIMADGSLELQLFEAYQNAADNICGRDSQSRPTQAELYAEDLHNLMQGRSVAEQREVVAFQQWKTDMFERQLQQDERLDYQQLYDGYGLRLDERRAVLDKVSMELGESAPTRDAEREQSR